MIDSAIAPADALTYPWPNPNGVRDLVYSRLLPVRQAIGQFLASYAPAVLGAGLRRVAVTHEEKLAAEARVVLAWLRRRLIACGAAVDTLAFGTAPLAAGAKGSLAVRFDYADAARFFQWSGDLADGRALLEANLGAGPTKLVAPMSLLTPENALSEAMFY